jgi:hypothetical protein
MLCATDCLGGTMSLTFAFLWNRDDEQYTFEHALTVLRGAVGHPKGTALSVEIDKGTARVIAGPHRTMGGDKKRHITVHCAKMMETWHIYVNKLGMFSGNMDREPQSSTKKPGHAKDDRNAPNIPDTDALMAS